MEDIETVHKHVILAPKNDDVNEINLQILNCLEGSEHTYTSIDSVICDNVEEEGNYPLEFLNTYTHLECPLTN